MKVDEIQTTTNWQKAQAEASNLIQAIENEWVAKTHTGLTQEQYTRMGVGIDEIAKKYRVPASILRKVSLWEAPTPPPESLQRMTIEEVDEWFKSQATEAIPAKVTGGKRIVKYERGSVGDAVRAATKLKSDVNLYVYPTAKGMAIAKEPPPFGLQHIIIRPDGTHKVISAGASFEAGRLAGVEPIRAPDFIPIGDLHWFTVNELQFLCGECGQETAGNKEALINRLKKVDKERLKAKIKEMKAIPPIPTLEQVQRGLRRQIRQMRGK